MRRFAPGRWSGPWFPRSPPAWAVRELGVYVPNEARHSSEAHGGYRAIPCRFRFDTATEHLEPPFAVVDLEAFDANAADLLRRAGGKHVRLATKSVRCRALIDRALGAGFRGLLAFTLPEALWLGRDDTVVAYPTVDRTALHGRARGSR